MHLTSIHFAYSSRLLRTHPHSISFNPNNPTRDALLVSDHMHLFIFASLKSPHPRFPASKRSKPSKSAVSVARRRPSRLQNPVVVELAPTNQQPSKLPFKSAPSSSSSSEPSNCTSRPFDSPSNGSPLVIGTDAASRAFKSHPRGLGHKRAGEEGSAQRSLAGLPGMCRLALVSPSDSLLKARKSLAIPEQTSQTHLSPQSALVAAPLKSRFKSSIAILAPLAPTSSPPCRSRALQDSTSNPRPSSSSSSRQTTNKQASKTAWALKTRDAGLEWLQIAWTGMDGTAMAMFAPAPAPKTKLGHYRVLSPNAGIHVSPIQLGAANIGDKWASMGWGAMDKESSFKLLDAYVENGGNFIDTANGYQDETSEAFIGEWMETRGIRDQLVVATKYSSNFKRGQSGFLNQASYSGNNLKSMTLSVEASLKKLRRVVMNGLHNLVVQGKVLYLGISDAPAWVVAQANQYREGSRQDAVCSLSGTVECYGACLRAEILPMARAHGLALAPWDVLAAGKFRTDAEEQARRESGEKGRTAFDPNWERNENEIKVSHALEKVAGEVGAKSIQAVAIAYVMHKAPYVFPIIGGRKIEHLLANVEALDIALSPEQIAFLEGTLLFDVGFPECSSYGDGTSQQFLSISAGIFVPQPRLQPIRPTRD
ncbi:Aldo-ket-red domain-containing protein [Mycena chlorophos]|uniref:Aldo-ket-red domain-containing protein n=1 Tax=Mycena chlorophos TaxID=658473 RepID=A0A8H6S4S5_MYCCL|nr:Aldo-ket-red domain-containing protein [Mycena chlorophos]